MNLKALKIFNDFIDKIARNEKLILFAILLTGLALRLWNVNTQHDDAFMTYRVAKNIADGAGFAYNVGESAWIITTPLYALILAVFAKFGLDLPSISSVIGIACSMGNIFLIYALCKRLGKSHVGLLAALFIVVDSSLVFNAVSGMETQFYILLLLSSVYFYFSGKYWAVGLLSGLLVLTRPDGLILPLILISHFLYTKRKIPYAAIILFLCIIIPWSAYSYFALGTLLPQSLAGKIACTGVSWEPFWKGVIYRMKLYGALMPFAIYGLTSSIFKNRKLLPISGWLVAYIGAYSILRLPEFPWYFSPVVTIFMLFAAIGVFEIFACIFSMYKNRNLAGSLKKIACVVIVLFLITLLFAHTYVEHYTVGIPQQEAMKNINIPASFWFKENTPENATISAIDFGMLSFYSERKTIDMVGLVVKEVTPHYAVKDYLWVINEYKPDYVIIRVKIIDSITLPCSEHDKVMWDSQVIRDYYIEVNRFTYKDWGWVVFKKEKNW